MRVNVKPHSPEWHAWRKSGLGASLAPAILGHSPYQTPRELAQELLGITPPKEMNLAMAAGLKHEDAILDHVNKTLGFGFEANACFSSDEYPHLLASIDGYDKRSNAILEIKLVGQKQFEIIKAENKPLKHHRAQVEQQRLVVKPEFALYAAYTTSLDRTQIKDVRICFVDHDPELRKEIIDKSKLFWDQIKTGQLPEPTLEDLIEIEDQELESMLDQYKQTKSALKMMTEHLQDLEKAMWARIKHPNARLKGATFQTHYRQGSINYKAIEALKGLNLDNYRSSPVAYRQIRLGEKE